MLTDVAGRVKNIQLPQTKPLLPLFEAIINSIHAIEDSTKRTGKIDITVVRDPGLLTENKDKQLANVVGFVIKDDGIGFNDKNFEAFSTSDTTNKANRGGKGIGRFMWLAAFDEVHIESVYKENEKIKKRIFNFLPKGVGVFNDKVETNISEPLGTTITLKNAFEKYQKICPKKLSSIAEFIIEEFLEYFIGPNCPKITLRDELLGEKISLDQFFEKEMSVKAKKEVLRIKNQIFDLLHVKLYTSHMSEHCLYLTAHFRAVIKDKLASRIPNLVKRLTEKDGKEFIYACYVTSDFLDKAVNSDRTNFNLALDETDLAISDISISEIRQRVTTKCKEFLFPFTEPVAKMKKKKIEKFIENEGVMYRPLAKRLDDEVINKIDLDSSEKDMDKILYEAYHTIQTEVRESAVEILNKVPTTETEMEEYEGILESYLEKISDVNQADLTRYVLHRKLVLDFLKKQLELRVDGKYNLEKRIHDAIFPRGVTSDDFEFVDQNLWLVDERLPFSVFLSSDKPLNKLKTLNNDSKKEPDILAFDKATAFSEAAHMPFGSITIIELKKPMRDDYGDSENPFVQIADYIEAIKNGSATKSNGAHLQIPKDFPFRCFILCDLTPKIRKWAKHFELHETPDGMGFFGYKEAFHSYWEVMSYEKLLGDAEKRNEAFFKKLGIK